MDNHTTNHLIICKEETVSNGVVVFACKVTAKTLLAYSSFSSFGKILCLIYYNIMQNCSHYTRTGTETRPIASCYSSPIPVTVPVLVQCERDITCAGLINRCRPYEDNKG